MPKKIFELAKELDVKALDLVEELKGFGFNVRNHMASLSDDDVTKALEMFNQKHEPAKKATKKKAKKKVVKKKPTATKKAASGEKTDEPKEAESSSGGKKKVVRRKAAVIKRKASASSEQKVEKVEEPVVDEPQVAEEVLQETKPVAKSSEKLPVTEEISPAAESAKVTDSKKVLFEEKQHSFTPVFIPEEKKEDSASAGSSDKPAAAREGAPPDAASADDKAKADSSKRLGGLAKMVAKPKASSRSRDLTQMRADEELKSYAGVGGTVLYRPRQRKKIYNGPSAQTEITSVKESKRVVQVHGGCMAHELADKLSVKFQTLADKALELNLLLKSDDYFGIQLASELAELYDYRVEDKAFDEDKILAVEQKDSDLKDRDPIITIMGHVDHGKTTLLDYIRKAKVADGEAGGITQHIGAYSVKVGKSTLTFLDTPGHAAFSSMRQRGANVTDIVVLVVAADDGVMPQTKESVRFIQNAEVPLIVAVNKMDKEGANPDRIKQELMEFNITPEEWGGDVQFVEISALKGDGVDKLLESISLQAEIMELKANPNGKSKGVVIESKIEHGRGPVATVLVQEGTLKKGDSIVAGETFGRARSLMDYSGKMLKSAGPSTPVEILGLNAPPEPGDIFNFVKNEREAKKIIENRINDRKDIESATAQSKMSLEDFFSTAQGEEKKVLKLIARADVQGSFEAIKSSLESLGNDEVGVEVIGGGVGAITDQDVNIAYSSKGYIVGFNMRPITSARRLAEKLGVDVKTYSIIYEMINDIKLALEGMLEPERVEVYLGRAEVRDLFSIPKIGVIAGSSVIDGKIQRGCNIRLLRDGKIVFDGKMSSLKRFKDDAKEVSTGYECGIGLENFNDIKVSDLFEAYIMEEKKRKLELSDSNAVL